MHVKTWRAQDDAPPSDMCIIKGVQVLFVDLFLELRICRRRDGSFNTINGLVPMDTLAFLGSSCIFRSCLCTDDFRSFVFSLGERAFQWHVWVCTGCPLTLRLLSSASVSMPAVRSNSITSAVVASSRQSISAGLSSLSQTPPCLVPAWLQGLASCS